MDSRVPSNLASGDVVVGGVDGEAEDVVSVGGVETLFVGGLVVDHTQSSNVVDHLPCLGVVEVATAVVTTVTVGGGVTALLHAYCNIQRSHWQSLHNNVHTFPKQE